MGQDAYLYVECDGEIVRDTDGEWRHHPSWYVERWPQVFRLLTGRSRHYEDLDMPEPIAPTRGLPPGWTDEDFERITGWKMDMLETGERACLTWYTLAELQAVRNRHGYLDELVGRIEATTPNPTITRIIVWVSN